ncbi:MAG: response regulator [Spirochaetales bacterium]|nr:response regulator [Spirochaetales bacterium]
MRILIVDDSTEIRSRLVKLVSEVKNARVVGSAGDGEEALKIIDTRKPDLVMLDLQMPKKSGLAVIKWIIANRVPTTILVLTNFATAHHAAVCEKLGASFFFDKMTEIEQAIEKIGELASGGGKRSASPGAVTAAGSGTNPPEKKIDNSTGNRDN